MWWTAILNALTGGVLDRALDAWKTKIAAEGDHERLAADLTAKDIEARTRIVTAMTVSWFTYLPLFTIAMSLAIYVAKLLVWDKVLGLGSTDPLTGDLREWARAIIYSMFGGGSAVAVAALLKR